MYSDIPRHFRSSKDEEERASRKLLRESSSDIYDSSPSPDRFPSRPKASSTVLRWLVRLASTTLIVIGALHVSYDLWFWHTSSSNQSPVSCACGSSVAEALSLGCRFDPIATAWLPKICRDDDLIDEFNHSGPGPDGAWNYYTDWNMTDTYPLEEVGKLADSHGHFFTTHEWHIKHCTFNWRKQYRLKETGVTLEARSDSIGHISHCEAMFLLRDPLDVVVTGAGVSLNADIRPKPHGHSGH